MDYLLIWDIDGTLILGGGIGRKAMDRAFLELYGVENGFEGINMAGMLDSIILNEAFQKHNLPNKNAGNFFSRYCECLEDEVKKLHSPIIAPGITPLFEALHKKPNLYNVLGTGNIEMGARIKLSVHDMNKYFLTGGFGDEGKERWQVIEKAFSNSCKFFNKTFANTNTYVIGDTPRDIACGKKLNLKTIGVCTGGYTREQLLECNPDYVFENFTVNEDFFSIFI